MKLQLSLDMVDLDEALKCIEKTWRSVDIIEVGTPLALKCGARAISAIKEEFPAKEILADFKIMDGGFQEAKIAFEAGADIVTVLGVSNDNTIAAAVSAARACQKKVMVDLIGVAEIEKRMAAIEKLGADFGCVHTAVDEQDGMNSPFSQFFILSRVVTKTKLAIAGGLNIGNLDGLFIYRPDIVIVGAGITAQPDPAKAAADIKRKLDEMEYGK